MQPSTGRGNREIDYTVRNLAVDQGIGATAYSVWIPAFSWDGPTPAAYNSPSSTDPGHWLFLGETTAPGEELSVPTSAMYVYYYLRVPIYWKRGHIEPILHWEFSNASVTYRTTFSVAMVENNTAIPAFVGKSFDVVTPTASVLWIDKGKVALDTPLAIPVYSSGEINPKPVGAYDPFAAVPVNPPNHVGLYLRVGRDASEDTGGAGDIKFYGAEIIFYPHEQSIGGKYAGDYYQDDVYL